MSKSKKKCLDRFTQNVTLCIRKAVETSNLKSGKQDIAGTLLVGIKKLLSEEIGYTPIAVKQALEPINTEIRDSLESNKAINDKPQYQALLSNAISILRNIHKKTIHCKICLLC